MKSKLNISFENQFICRQYNEKCKFTNYNEVIKKLQCNHVLSFNDCQISSTLQDNYEVPVSSCKFSNKLSDILAVANENGIVCIENIKKLKKLKYIQTHENTVYDIAWMPGSMQFVTVSGDNSAKLWECRESDVSLLSTFTGHKRSVRCVSFKPENTAVFATGSRDGSLMIWDTRAWIKCAKFSHHIPDQIICSFNEPLRPSVKKNNVSSELLNSKSITGLVFQNDNTLISCGSMDRYIKVWDMRKTYSRSASNSLARYQLASPKSGFSYLCKNEIGTKLYANCMDSYIYCYNINSYDPDPVAAFYGHENGSFYVKSSVSSDGLYLMSGSSDECAYIWNTKNAELSEFAVKPFVFLNSHTAEVTCVEMCPDGLVVVSCSDDGTFRLWNPYKLRTSEKQADIAGLYDVENVQTVKTQWKNKRKFSEIDELIESTPKNSNCSHTKICRFYTVNHSSPCICHTKFLQGKGEKRKNDDPLNENEVTKKRTLEVRELTPPKQSESKQNFAAQFLLHVSPAKRSNAFTKVASKRKLEDMPDFMEESKKSKRNNFGKILTPSNLVKNNTNDVVKDESQDHAKKEIRISSKELRLTEHNSNSKNSLPGLSSPTSNLPNYVEDGTSPYVHRCLRVTQKENDWLTKLRKNYEVTKALESKQSNLGSLASPGFEKKKKLNKSLDHTLHRYFKVSSKAIEKPLILQEIQKKVF